jgi:hypothetical protein
VSGGEVAGALAAQRSGYSGLSLTADVVVDVATLIEQKVNPEAGAYTRPRLSII